MSNKKYLNNSDKYSTIDEESSIKDLILSSIFSSKPFGIIWRDDIMERFLKARGYRIIEKQNPNNLDYYKYAIESTSEIIPEDCEASNLPEVFDMEVQNVLINWLLSLK